MIGIGSSPRRFGSLLCSPSYASLAALDPYGLTQGTLVYVPSTDEFFALKTSDAELVEGEVIEVAGVDGARWLLVNFAGGGNLPTENMVAHYDAALGLHMGVVVPTQLVGWDDQSGNDRNLANMSGGATIVAADINGLPTVSFPTGSSPGLTYTGSTGIAAGAARTFVTVLKPSAASGGPVVSIKFGGFNFQVDLLTIAGTQYIQTDQAGSDISAVTPVDYSGVPLIMVVKFTGAALGLSCSINGTNIPLSSATPANDSSGNDGIAVGVDNNGSHTHNIRMAEAVIYSDAVDEKIAQAVAYFSSKYDIDVA